MLAAAAELGVSIEAAPRGYRILSRRGRHLPFLVAGEIRSWDRARGPFEAWGSSAFFHDTEIRIRFEPGAVLLVYPGGFIRYMERDELAAHAALSRGREPDHRQGDLLFFLWPRAGEDARWTESDTLALGGSANHRATGRLRYRSPVEGDPRTIHLETLSEVVIRHHPTDEVHPLVMLGAGGSYLATKLPGSSDPAREGRALP